ncbi:DUF427 domain-containing protein [uncultured Pseudokineococcus sp.]|uniref:DUF427 domain-containing protein n=1 Tax=uncultured Pseudokineococcus sp. TaxID=1642928 RepID=UPI00261AD0A8|nr:DUF427 domain-containing protein [uncultured Pseudokineococcus sp.]
MSLTLGGGPLSRPTPGTGGAPGQLNVPLPASPAHLLFLHDAPLRVRGLLAGEVVLDTRRARLLHETGLLPQWYVPAQDVRTDLLQRTATTTTCPFKGEASYWTARVGDRVEEDLVWGYEDPHPEISGLRGLLAVPFERLDAWYEEDEELLGHPRDPFHRVDTRRSTASVEVRLAREGAEPLVLARTSRAVALAETGLPVRWYVPEADVATDALEPSATTTQCPYKGVASYRTAVVEAPADQEGAGARRVEDVAWTYPEPLDGARAVAGHLCFAGDGVEVLLDGTPAPS